MRDWLTEPRRVATVVLVGIALLGPLLFSALASGSRSFYLSLAADSAIAGILLLSLVVLTGMVGQISFCQFSFAAIGAFTVGALADHHHWSFWFAWPIGIGFAALVGVLVGIPALRLSGLYLAILTVAVALVFDRWLLASGTADFLTGGGQGWRPGRPGFLGFGLEGPYAFYLFCLGAFLLCTWIVWNLRTAKTGRVLRAIKDSEIAASTMGLDLTAWKLAAFGISAGMAGMAGGLFAVATGSVTSGSYDFQHSVQLAAVATVWGVGSIASPAFGGVFLFFGPELLRDIGSSWNKYFPVILGGLLIVQLILTPDGIVADNQRRFRQRRARRGERHAGAAVAGPGAGAAPDATEELDVLAAAD